MDFERVERWLGGRSRRGEYWLSVLGLVVLNGLLNFVLGDLAIASLIGTPFWLVVAARRLHDFGQTGWWGLIPFAAGFVLGFSKALGFAISPASESVFHLVIGLAISVIIGAIPGNPLANRFGEPQKAGR